MPALSAPQLALLRAQYQTSNWYCVPIAPVTVFAALVNSASITVGAVTIPYDTVTVGAFGNVLKGMTCLVGSAAGLSDYGILRIRLDADASNLYVAWNSDIAWADNLYLTVYQQFLAWSVRQRIVPPTIYKDYNIAYTDQTNKWPPVALMGDNVCKLWAGNPTPVYFDGSGSYPVAQGATITSYAWAFGDGNTATGVTPGNHNYTAAGTYYATLTVTDSNGKTHLTRRIVALPDPASIYTVKFDGTSLEAAVDDGWKAKVRVFDPNADITHFPERAPCFLISTDSYGGTVGSVGFPTGREDVVLFGYIVEDSVAIQPEYNDITFDLESIAGVMGRADSPPVYLGDSSNPAGEPDAWAWGKSLNVFRGLVYLLKFHSTVMDIADVTLYNDTTLTKAVDYPQDNLWNMLLQFAKGKRLMRAGVTRTGRVVVGRDPNLVPVASRSSFTTVCTLAQGDWKEQVTAPQKPYPVTSFICISGLSYDGDPVHEPSPLFGMSPGRPPKDYGAEREIQYLKLVDQTECNTLAGLLLGTDNMPYGDIVIPMRGNWVKCFEPALQEYVQTPSGGWVTKRGTLLDTVKLIVRKVSVAFDWANGTMMPTLTCDYYSQPEIGVNGDCFPPDAPPPPQQSIPPIIPPPHPVPTSGANLDVWTLFDTGDIYRLTMVAPSLGTGTTKSNWKSAYGSGSASPRTPLDIAPSLGALVNILSTRLSGVTDVAVQHSTNDAGAFSSIPVSASIDRALMRRDPQKPNSVWLAIVKPTDGSLLPSALAYSGVFDNTSILTVPATDFVADTGDILLFYSSNGGASWANVLLGYLNQLWATQVCATEWNTANFNLYHQAYLDEYTVGGGGNSPGLWDNLFTTAGGPFDALNGDAFVGVDMAYSGSVIAPLGYFMYNPSNIRNHSLNQLFPSYGIDIAPNGTGLYAFVIVSGFQISHTLDVTVHGSVHDFTMRVILNSTYPDPRSSGGGFAAPFIYEAEKASIWKVSMSSGASTSRIALKAEYSLRIQTDTIAIAVADLKVDDFIYTLSAAHYFTRMSYVPIVISFTYADAAARLASSHSAGDIGKFALQSDNGSVWKLIGTPSTWEYINGAPVSLDSLFGSSVAGLFCTTQGTVLVATANGHIHRTTDRGQTWSDITIAGVTSFGTFFAAESHGVIGGAVGPIVAPIGTSGKYVFSLNDGASWAVSSDLTPHTTVLSNYAR